MDDERPERPTDGPGPDPAGGEAAGGLEPGRPGPDPVAAPPPLPPPEEAGLDRLGPLVRDMRFALRSEFGAYSLYLLLPLVARNAELRRLLLELRREQREQIEALRGLIEDLGGTAPRSRWTRALAAWGLFLISPVSGMRLPLRLCYEAERTVSRWYGEYAWHLALHGRFDEAARCQQLELVKRIHATRLWSFVSHLGGS